MLLFSFVEIGGLSFPIFFTSFTLGLLSSCSAEGKSVGDPLGVSERLDWERLFLSLLVFTQ